MNQIAEKAMAEYGFIGLLSVSFVGLLFYVLKKNAEREEKLTEVITTALQKLPELEIKIDNLTNEVKRKKEL